MGDFHWETKAYTSTGKKEVSIIQTWFDGTETISKQTVVLLSDELIEIARKI
jgi:hypothetical protein